ncbi:hypothetical protein AB0E08_08145 [Streptomyces sp. NPDC048281]|uniref:hypothetical protein n=1 Tax=Streptomyces sp. NPDC048281 TaxID=3154715 RepID=UPI0034402D15
MKTSLTKAPYNSTGHLINYVHGYAGDVPEWRPNKPFPALLGLQGITRGMSAARFCWLSDKGQPFEMFMTDAADLMKGRAPLYAGTVDSWWMIIKRGQNYGIRLADTDDLQRAGHVAGPKTDCLACRGVTYAYEDWCPLPPTPDKPHQFRPDPTRTGLSNRTVLCLCGAPLRSTAHPGMTCTCSSEDNTACSDPGCKG